MQALRLLRIPSFVVILVACLNLSSVAQQEQPAADSSQAVQEYASTPWTDGTVEEALQFSAAGKTIPLTNYSIVASKDGTLYSGVLVGGNPFVGGPRPVTLQAVVVPIVIQIFGNRNATFDPTKADPCDSNVSALIRFIASPMVNPMDLTFNGVDVGYYQYVDGYMRAQFWNVIKALKGGAGYSNPIVWSYAPRSIFLRS